MTDKLNNSPYLLIAAFTIIVIGVRLYLISTHGSQAPYWDDWIIGLKLNNYLNDGFSINNVFFSTNNQHRWVFTKLLNIGLFNLNHDQWDPLVPMVFNSFVWAATGALLIFIAYRNSQSINAGTFTFFVFVLWIYPLSIFNVLSTIQSLNYFMICFVLVGCWLLTYRAKSIKWAFGLLFIAMSGLSYAGGILAPIVISIISAALALLTKKNKQQHINTAIGTGAVSLLSVHHILSNISSNASSASTSIISFFTSLAKTLSWPLSEHTWPFLIFILPLLLFSIAVLRKKNQDSQLSRFTLFIGGFSIAIAVAIASSRGQEGLAPANRYYEFMSIYLIANLLALLQLTNLYLHSYKTKFLASLKIVWLLCIFASIDHQLFGLKFLLNEHDSLVPVQESVISEFNHTRNMDVFLNKKFREVPFPHHEQLSKMIIDFERNDIMPYQFQLSDMRVFENEGAFTIHGVGAGRGPIGLYQKQEPVMGSYIPTRGSQNNKGKYITEFFKTKRPYIMVPTQGYLGFPGTTLKLVGKNNKDEKLIPHHKNAFNAHTWTQTIIPAPDSEYSIHATDNSNELWFAFAAPRTVGRLSYYAYQMLNNNRMIWISGILLLAFSLRKRVTLAFTAQSDSRSA